MVICYSSQRTDLEYILLALFLGIGFFYAGVNGMFNFMLKFVIVSTKKHN